MISRRRVLGMVAILVCAAGATASGAQGLPQPMTGPPAIPGYVQKAVDAADRPAGDKARDAGRMPAAVFAYSGIKPGDRVIEIAAFGQYDTRIMVNIVGPTGHIYMYDLPYQQATQEASTKTFTDAHPTTEHVFGKFDDIAFPKDVDLITIDMYYHDLNINNIDQAKFNKQMFEALKAGGRVLIVDHNAAPGAARATSNKVHRIDPAIIISEMQTAGFRLAVNSPLFANASDDRSKMIFAPGERGSTDRSLLVFEKP